MLKMILPKHASEKLFRILVCFIVFGGVCVCKQNNGSWYTQKLNKRNYIPRRSIETPIEIGKRYEEEINATTEHIYNFCDTSGKLTDKAIRVHVASEQANRAFPVIIVVRQHESVLSWKLPLLMFTSDGVDEYHYAERTLCPVSKYDSRSLLSMPCYEDLVVSVSTSSPVNVEFSLFVKVVEDFYISFGDSNRTISLTPSQPHYYGFKFPDGTNSALLTVNSDDNLCMTISIQNIICPVYDLQRNVRFKGLWLTMQTKGGINFWKNKYQEGVYIVLVVQADDTKCSGVQQTSSRYRNKTVSFSIEHNISSEDYALATTGALAVIIVFYICLVIVPVNYVIRKHEQFLLVETENIPQRCYEGNSPLELNGNTSDSLPPPRRECGSTRSDHSRDSSSSAASSNQIHDGNSVDDRANDVNAISRSLPRDYVSDLAKKDLSGQRRKSNSYVWSLLSIAVFYALPVVQLVLTHQMSLYKTGNDDMCYYNFLCANPLGLFSDFNHVFSNIGYVLLGILFIIITYQRDRHYKKAANQRDAFEREYGVPQQFGLFYAMGEALIMEGILSGCYHICPNRLNFQFDTSFMYVICIFLMLKIYQTRHPDVIANSHATFIVLAGVIFIGLIGVLQGSFYFYLAFSFVHAITCITLSVQIYYKHKWKLDLQTFGRVLTSIQKVVCGGEHLENKKCMVLLVIGNLCNLGIIIYGIFNSLDDFATHLLTIFLANLILYIIYYPVMKLLHHEKILTQPLIYILLAVASWSVALYFYQTKSASWDHTPAQSRAFSHRCIVLNFYDGHDVWHFLSATGMFFSFMVILTLDDDLVYVKRTEIPIF